MRYQIGRLSRSAEGYHFSYDHQSPRGVDQAREVGFQRLEAFHDLHGDWKSPQLFPTFARRLPKDWSHKLFGSVGLRQEQDLEFLGLTGGRLATDSLEFLQPASASQETGSYHLRFPIAGWRYHQGGTVVGELARGTSLDLRVESDNEYDSCAVSIFSPSGLKLGYVPSIYSYYIDSSVERRTYKATIDEVGHESDPQLRVVVEFCASIDSLDGAREIPPEFQRYAEAILALC